MKMEATLGRTVVKTKEYYNTWIVEHFEHIRKGTIKSPEFSGTNWHGQWLTWSYEYEPSVKCRFFRIHVRSKQEFVKQSCRIKVVDCSKMISGLLGSDLTVGFDDVAVAEYNRGLPGELGRLKSDGSLELRFQVTFFTQLLEVFSTEKQVPLPALPLSTLAENLTDMLMHKQFTDLTISVGKQRFQAHKAVLVARSKVFAAMFRHDMQESKQNEITITDVEPSVFEQVLRFIYTDKVEGLPVMARELLAAADKYDLARLKVMCEIQMFKGITVESATETLQFADLHRAKELKARAIDFLATKLRTISNWEQFCSARPDLVAEILKKVASFN